MLNIIWCVLLMVGILCGIATGRTEAVTEAVVNCSREAVTFAIGMVGICAFWCGLIRILEAAGGLAALQKWVRPVIVRLFPSAKKDPETQQNIITNLTADFLGLGNGATPSGIAAVQGLSRLGGDGERASRDICLFLVLNTAALQLMPTTVIAMRAGLGSQAAMDILLPTWITSLGAVLMALLAYRICRGRR
ncbi:MAG: hypothetical protein IKU26_04085 [Clostridia bacterium]|nr:hypothetical protein [Clostridia bacterium]